MLPFGSVVDQAARPAAVARSIAAGGAIIMGNPYGVVCECVLRGTCGSIDIAVRREDLERIARAAAPFGLEHRHVAGMDMLVRSAEPSARRAVYLVFAGEKVRPEYLEAVPALGAYRTVKGIRLMPLEDVIRMKLTSFRLRDATHLKDLDEAGLITGAVESGLPPLLRERLAEVRARE